MPKFLGTHQASMTHRSKGLVRTVVSRLERVSLTTEHEKVDLLQFGNLSRRGDLDVDFSAMCFYLLGNSDTIFSTC